MRKQYSPATLEEHEWNELLRAFANSSFLKYVERLRVLDNVPQKANELFDKGHWFADDSMNVLLHQRGLPFRVKRIGPNGPGGIADRFVAIVRWTNAQQLHLPLFPNHRQRRSGNRP